MTSRFSPVNSRSPRWRAGALLPILLFSIAVLFSGSRLMAQTQNAIQGTVTDASGAVIAGAHVTVTNDLTGVVSTAVTATEGTFTIIGLIPGRYTVAVDATGFKKTVTDVLVEVAKTSTVSLQMELGAMTQTVEVKASAITLDTTAPNIGTTLEPELVKQAPIEISGLARQIDSFMFLAPGVQGNASSHNINGGVTFENDVQFNGVPVAFVDYSGNQTYINPPYEAVGEFRVNSSTFDAKNGLGQGVVTYSMASGTNQLHGDAFEIVRNQFFDSVGFFPTRFLANGQPAPPINQQNNFGFTVGGPVVLPKIYNGKNRTFFHVSLDWFRQNLADEQIGTVPTTAMKNGDFSQFVNSAGVMIPIYDPLTGQPFPGNIIPQSRFSSVAKSTLPLIPSPDRAGINFGLESNKSPSVSSIPIRQHLWAYTIDHNISSSQSIHFSQWRDSVNSPFFTWAPIVPASDPLQSEIDNTQLGSVYLVNYAKTISPNLVVTAGGDYVRNNNLQDNANTNVHFPGVTGGITFPLVNFDGQNAPTSWGVNGFQFLECCEGGLTVDNNRKLGMVLDNNWLWTKGRNTFNIGGEIRRTFQDIVNCAFCSGTFNFSQRSTSTPNSNDPNFGLYGSSFASFLLGEADAGERIFANVLYLRNKDFAPYIQDDIKISKRFTGNIGLRWDVMVPFTEDHNNILYVNQTEPDPGAGGLLGAATKFGNCAGCSGITRADIHWKNLQPRIGFAYQVSPKTVIRSGFYLTFLDGGAYEYGTSQTASFTSSLLDGSYLRASTGSSLPGYGSWDATPMPLPQPTPFSPSIGNAGIIFAFFPAKDGTAPYDFAWNFGVQRQLPWNMFLTASYVGNRAIHLPTTLSLNNQPVPGVLKYGSLLGEPVNSPDAVAAGIKIPYPNFVQQFGGAATVEQALTPFPQFGGYFPVYEHQGTALYNALQVQAEKRFSNGLSYLADVTISRLMANTAIGSAPYSPNGLNAFNTRPEYVPSFLDQLYNMHFVTSYELPIGSGKRHLNSRGLFSRLMGGWQVSGIFTYAGGSPFGAFNNFNPLLVNGFDRPNIVPSAPLTTYSYNLTKDYFQNHQTGSEPLQFTTNAFVNTGPWQVGDSLRAYSALRTPPLRIENMDIVKSFNITERVRASVRFDCFNCFDRVQLQAPDNNSLDSTFGQITNLSSQIINRQGQATFRLEF